MIIDGLSIPPGLEQLFYNIFRPLDFTIDTTLATNKPRVSYRQKSALNAQSLFVRWQGLYNGFDSSRKMAWATYWETLPFGTHSGGNGWPGSGFSAFVYVNAPRYKASEDLLLDPPSSFPELIVNGDFNGNTDDWTLYLFTYVSNDIELSSVADFGTASTNVLFDLVDVGTYQIQCDVSISSGTLYLELIDTDTAFVVYTRTLTSVDNGHFSDTFSPSADFDNVELGLETEEFTALSITNISLKQIS